jgi:prepilin-type N-terminal cleavage/methylation domain-containing protein
MYLTGEKIMDNQSARTDIEYIMKRSDNKGFTLLEMTIVLIIIGLLVGGVLMGQSLVKSAAIKDLMTDMDYYTTATKTFQDRYNALPGDMPNATTVWGELNATPATCIITASASKLTCNGNGNGRLDLWNEDYLFFKHLSNAGIIKGNYTGTGDPAGGQVPSINNIPATSVNGTFVSAGYLDINPGTPYFDGPYGNFLVIGAIGVSGGVTYPDMPSLIPEQAQEIDNKMDDGKPGVGIIRSHVSSSARNPNCATTAVASTAAYNVSSESNLCSLIYLTGF